MTASSIPAPLLLLLLLAAGVGCSDEPGVVSATATATVGSTTLEANTSSGPAVTETGAPGSSSSTTSPGTTTGLTETESNGTMLCDEPDAVTSAWIEEDAPLDGSDFQNDAVCVVDQVDDLETGFAYDLLCDEGGDAPTERRVRLTSAVSQPAPLIVGETVRAQLYRDFSDTGTSTYVRLSAPEGDTLVAYYEWPVRSSVPDTVAAWFDVSVETFDANCTPVEPEVGGMFVQDPCPAIDTRVGVVATWAGVDLSLGPGELVEEHGAVYAADASQLEFVEESCGATTRAWVSMVRLRE